MGDMQKFLALTEEKQRQILSGAMGIFGAVGYKKAFASDIARAAGISKAMIFYYFGSKKELYLYLVRFAGELLEGELQVRTLEQERDFFRRIQLVTEIEVSVMRRFPGILPFLTSVYFEDDAEVAADVRGMLSDGQALSDQLMLGQMDLGKFEDDVDPHLVLQIVRRYAEGCVSRLPKDTDADALEHDFERALALMRAHFYKPEFR